MKTKKTILNFITDIIPLAIVSILGIFKIKIFIQTLGDETLGLYQLFSQIMTYIALVDGGLASAVLYSLYKPNIENDNEKVNSILSGAFKVFSIIGAIVFLIAAIIAFVVPFLIKGNTFPYYYIVISFLLFSLSNVIGYFFVPIQSLLEVKEKKYIVNLGLQIGQIIQSILEIILLLNGWSFFAVLIMHSVIKLLSNIAITIVSKKVLPDYNLRSNNKSFEFVKKVKDLVFHKINGLVGSNIDVIIISKLLGLSSVAIYSTYNYIINMLKQILGKVGSSMLAIVGNEMVNNRERVYDLLLETNALMFYIATILCIPLLFAINGFIDIWYEGTIKTSQLIGLAFSLYLFCFIIKNTVSTFVTSAGLFKETKICAIFDTIINLSLSLLLVFKFGISGVLFATSASVIIAEFIMKNIVLHKHVFKKSVKYFYLKSLKYFVFSVFDLGIGIIIFKNVVISNLFIWFVIFIGYTLINSIVVLFIYKLFKETIFIDRFKKILKRG